ncbi:MAG: hypothetical protein Q4C64_07005 [Erysipelotrichia bacterium]|nr:hypothetical protein [Erysipelotrichia bacterium]
MIKKLFISLVILLYLFGCQIQPKTDAQKFKRDYEQLNGKLAENGLEYANVVIPEESKIKYIQEGKLIEVMTNGTHVVYLGWPDCPYCRICVPILLETVAKYSGINVYYYNIKELREAYQNDLDDENSRLYKQLCSLISQSESISQSIFDTFDDGTLKLAASTVYFIKDGELIGCHRGTVDSHLSVYEPLDEQQVEELSAIYEQYLDEMVKKSPIGCSEC